MTNHLICDNCFQDKFKEGYADRTIQLEDCNIHFKNMPAHVCQKCGHKILTDLSKQAIVVGIQRRKI